MSRPIWTDLPDTVGDGISSPNCQHIKPSEALGCSELVKFWLLVARLLSLAASPRSRSVVSGQMIVI